jgi:ubiquinol-cytochrome c reductase cytochrome c1 subunit
MMTMKTLTLASVAALMLGTAPVLAQSAPGALAADDQAAAAEHNEGTTANAGHAEPHIQDVQFSFEGPFGTFDEHQLQRGLQVFTEVCSACHGMKFVPIRTLTGEGGPNIPEDQVRAYAANLDIFDPELDDTRPRKPTDHFPTVTGPGMGPDLSVMAKARAGYHGPYGTGLSQLFNGIGGPEYIYSILNGYTGNTKDEAGTTFYENTAFPGGWIAMPPPLSDGQVEFRDGSPNDVPHMAKDIASFLMWAAEPHMMDRKKIGFVSVIFLGLLTVLLYLTNKKIWAPVKGRKSA